MKRKEELINVLVTSITDLHDLLINDLEFLELNRQNIARYINVTGIMFVCANEHMLKKIEMIKEDLLIKFDNKYKDFFEKKLNENFHIYKLFYHDNIEKKFEMKDWLILGIHQEYILNLVSIIVKKEDTKYFNSPAKQMYNRPVNFNSLFHNIKTLKEYYPIYKNNSKNINNFYNEIENKLKNVGESKYGDYEIYIYHLALNYCKSVLDIH